MKTLYTLALCMICYACFPAREVQAEMLDATLVKIEVINRYPNVRQKVLTWQTERSVSFVTFESASYDIALGTHAKVLVQK